MNGRQRMIGGVFGTLLLTGCTSPAPDASTSDTASLQPAPSATEAPLVSPSAPPSTPALTPAPTDSVTSVTSPEGLITANIPNSWEYSSKDSDRRADSGGVIDVLGVWTVETPLGQHHITIEADSQASPVFDARSYYAAFFANTDASLGQVVDHEFFVASDGSEGLWIAATADPDSAAADEVAFFLFTPDRILVGRAAATDQMDPQVASSLHDLARTVGR